MSDLPEVPGDDELARKVARAELWKRLAIVSFAILNASVLAVLISVVFLIRQTQTEGSPTTRRLIAISEQIADCTNEGGRCAARSAKSTGAALVLIDKRNTDTLIAGLVCQERLQTDSEAKLRRCIEANR